MSGPISMGSMALGGNPYVTKMGGKAGSPLAIQPVQQYKGNSNTMQAPQVNAPTLGSTIAGAVQGIPNQIQQMQQLMQWRQQMNGGSGGLFAQQQPMTSDPGGVWAGNPTQAQVGPENPTAGEQAAATADAGNQASLASSMPSGMNTGGTDVAGQAVPGGAGGMSMAGKIGLGSAIGSAIAAPIEKAGQQEQAAFAALKPTITDQQAPIYPMPQIGGGSLVV